MPHEVIRHQSDGLSMRSDLYLPTGSGPFPGVLVFPEAFGLGDHARQRAERLASEGYAALACDLHGEARMIGMDTLMQVLGPLASDQGRVRGRVADALSLLSARDEVDSSRIAAIGYCFGGTMALELARSGADIRGAVGFHSGLGTATPGDAANIKGKVLVCIGADDPFIKPEERLAFEQEMQGGGVDWRMDLYGGVVHSFTNPEADSRNMPDTARYDAAADAHSWGELLAFLSHGMTD